MNIKNIFISLLSIIVAFSASGCTAAEPSQEIKGKLMFITKYPEKIAVLENNKIRHIDFNCSSPKWSLSGKRIMTVKKDGIFICNEVGEILKNAIDGEESWNAWDWLGDDNVIVVAERTNYQKGVKDSLRYNLVTYDINTRGREQLTDFSKYSYIMDVNASLDGKFVVYRVIWGDSVYKGDPYDLYLFNLETKENILIENQSAKGNFAPDNETVVYEKIVHNNGNDFMGMAASYIMTYNVKTGEKKRLINEPYYGMFETFNLSPDLKTLIFSGGGQTYIVDVETGEKKNLFEQFKKKDRKWKATNADWFIE